MSSIISERLFARFESEFRPHIGKLGLGEDIFRDPSVRVSVENYIDLLELTAAAGHPDIGLDMGDRVDFSDFGVFGHAISATQTLLHALQVVSRYLIVFAHDNTFRVDLGASRLSVTYVFHRQDIPHHRQDAEFALAALFRLMSRATTRNPRPLLVEFRHAQPRDVTRHKSVFGCPIRFCCSQNRIHFHRAIGDWPVESSDARLLEVLENHLTAQLRLRSTEVDLMSKVRHLVASGIHEGLPSIETVARKLGLSSRSLQRELARDGGSFSDVLDQVRAGIGIEYVRGADMKFSEVAKLLSYDEASSFSRAYKRWTGKTPFDDRRATFKGMGSSVAAD